MNPTIEKFGYPQTLLREYGHWLVLLRPAQVTLGSLVLAAKSAATAYAQLPAEAFAEQAKVVGDIERALGQFVAFQKINYLMLMMVDREVHFHVVPRYDGLRSWDGVEFPDRGWPKLPDLASAPGLDASQVQSLVESLRNYFANH